MPSAPRQTRPKSAFEQIRSWVLSGALPPGQRLPVRDVARGLGLSTMPVREALVRLAETGLVTQEPHKGAVVSTLSPADLSNCYGLRQIIEPQSIGMGVERMTPERLARLRSAMTSLESAVAKDNLLTVLDRDEELLLLFHAAVANDELTRVIKSTWARVRPYKLLFTTTAQPDASERIADEDARLLRAAEAGDSAEARAIMVDSLANAQLRLADLLRSHEAGEIASHRSAPIRQGDLLATTIARLAARSRGTNDPPGPPHS